MATLNYGTKELVCKVVYYGPGMGGKTTNLQQIHAALPDASRGEMTSLATHEDRTLFFDLLPMDIGKIGEFSVRLQLYTVPGQVQYNATRKVVLKGVDGVVIVFDSDPEREMANCMSLSNLEENLADHGRKIKEMPVVFQYNKRDLPMAMQLKSMRQTLNPEGHYPDIEAVAIEGAGVMETVRKVCSMVFERLEQEIPAARREGTAVRKAAQDAPIGSAQRRERALRAAQEKAAAAQAKAAAATAPPAEAPKTEAPVSSKPVLDRPIPPLALAPKPAAPALGPDDTRKLEPPPEPKRRETPPPAPTPAAAWNGRVRQLSEMRVGGLLVGHAIIDLEGRPARKGQIRRATLELRPLAGASQIEHVELALLDGAAPAGAGREAYRGKWSDGSAMRLVVQEREDATGEFYLDWNTRMGRASLVPEGRSALARQFSTELAAA